MSGDESGGDWQIRPRASRSGGGDSGSDDWGFLADRAAAQRGDAEQPAQEAEPAAPRARGEIREGRTGPSLRRRALPMAVCLLAISLAGFLTEVVASSQVLSTAGPRALLWIYPLGGLGLVVVALLQFRFVDHRARLPMIRAVAIAYAIAFVLALVLVQTQVAPVPAVSAMWILGDQLNFLMPLLIWSLAGDEFNAAEGKKVFGWIVAWTYGGQVLGLVVATAAPTLLRGVDVPLWSLLTVVPIVALAVGLWLPRAMRSSAAATGTAREESWGDSVRGAWDFVSGIPTWRAFFVGSVITFVAGMTLFLAFFAGAEDIIGSDDATLQTFIGAVSLAAFVICWLLQVFVAERLLTKAGIAGTLLILPIATVVAAALLGLGLALGSLPLLAIGVTLWLIPRWSVDENARRGALTLVPDQRRARVSFIVDLLPVSLGLIASGPLAVLAVVTGTYWAVPVIAGLAAVVAVPFLMRMRRTWEDSLLDWRLRRRKQGSFSMDL